MQKRIICLLLTVIFLWNSIPALAYQNPISFYDDIDRLSPAGDPFVMKYNGTYYCYVSGNNCWRSNNLVDWEFVGCVFQGEHSFNLYAPEVFHWNGAFYCISCPDGTTNYLFKSEKPEGPFYAISDDLGGHIDGTLFRDDDGSIWFMHAAWNGIELYSMETPESTPVHVDTLPQNISGMWTEGPGVFKRNGLYYMTYTGNHVFDDAYRVEYAMSENISSGWYEPKQNILLLSTFGDTVALGHNSVVIGPDLDSYYIVYHNFYPKGTSIIDRAYNMQRILWNDNKPTVAYCSSEQDNPELPDFESRPDGGIKQIVGKELSENATKDIFTAEFNLIPRNTNILFVYKNSENYCRLSFSETSIKYEKTENGISNIKVVPMTKNTSIDVLQCIRIKQSSDNLTIYLEGGQILETSPVGGGQIGYESEKGQVGYTAFSNKVLGNEDYTAQKFAGNTYDAVFANNYKDLTLVKAMEDGNALQLSSGEHAYFDLTVPTSQNFTVGIRGRASEETIINLYVNNKLVKEKIVFPKCNTYRTEISRGIKLPKRETNLKIEILSGKFEFYQIETTQENKVEQVSLTFDDSTHGMTVHEGLGLFSEGKYLLRNIETSSDESGSFSKSVIGDIGWGDYSAEVKVKLNEPSSNSQVGIYLRSKNLSNTESSEFNFKKSWYKQGYYICIANKSLYLYKHNYNQTLLSMKSLNIDMDKEHTLKVSAVGDTITIFLDGEEMIKYSDVDHPFTNGKMGLQVVNGSASFDDLIISPIEATTKYDVDSTSLFNRYGIWKWTSLILACILFVGSLVIGFKAIKMKRISSTIK